MTELLRGFSSWTRLIRDGDLCPLVCLIWLLLQLGRFAVADAPRLQLIGFRIAAGVALLYVITDLIAVGLQSPADALRILIRGLAAGGLVLGPCWVALAVIDIVWQQLSGFRSRIRAQLASQRQARQRRRQEILDRERQRLAAIEWERTRPERERAAREAAERARQEATALSLAAARQAAERKRRDEARFNVLVVYDKRAAGYGERIPRTRLLGYLDRYLGDDVPLEVIEERAKQLTQLLQETSRGGRTASPFQGLDDIAAQFQKRREQIMALPYDDETRETLLFSLNAQEEAAIREFLRP
jgi:hypothetical protein